MSGVCGVYYLDGMVATVDELSRMVALLDRRGPDGQGQWSEGPIGLGHTLLWTLPESLPGKLPFECSRSGCVITGDVRLDNRDELLAALEVKSQAATTCDEQVVLDAYLAWGEGCLNRLLGDFAFVIWNSREKNLFGARDRIGVRPFYYHHAPGRLFAFASEPRSILALERVPRQINEGRIADFLVSQLEGIDKTSTFFEAVSRLPPAHCVRVSPERIYIRRYWSLEPESELRLPSNDAYAEAFLNVFSEAVRRRLRGKGRVGSMLSGGMDSGSIVAVASQLLRQSGGGPLPTFSAISEDETNCVETEAVRAALTMNNLEPRTVHPGQFNEFQPELDELTWNLDEPFDNNMTLPRVIYLAAHRAGVKAVLDGIDGDTALSEGNYLARLMQQGCWWTAYVETFEQLKFWGPSFNPFKELVGNARLAFVPQWLRRLRARLMHGQQCVQTNIRTSAISSEFAKRIDLAARLNALRQHRPNYLLSDPGHEHKLYLEHPYLTVGVERYGRVASAIGVEPRHPFLDLDVLKFCVTLPGAQKLRDGWPKAILRGAMARRLPEPVRWRRGKQHLGWDFTVAYCRQGSGKECLVDANWVRSRIGNYTRRGLPRSDWTFDCDQSQFDDSYNLTHLAVWFDRMRWA